MLRLNELKLPLNHSDADLAPAICKRLKLSAAQLLQQRVVKRSVDARNKRDIRLAYSVEIGLDPALEQQLLRRFRNDPHLVAAADNNYQLLTRAPAELNAALASGALPRPIVIGAGPCGYFCALLLAQMGLRPLLLERGKPVKERSADTFGFWKGT